MPGSVDLRKALLFGTGLGIEIRGKNLEIVLVRVRPSGVSVLGATTISGFQERPAAEWGAEYARFLKQHGATYLSATVLLPRRETIVRHLAMPGVANRDLASAITIQLETLHPYGEDDVAHGWCRLGKGAVLIGIVRRATLEHYLDLFTEAGISVASFTFSATAIYAAHRLMSRAPHAGFLAVNKSNGGLVEIYGESSARPVFSAEFDLPVERAAALAAAELRLAPDALPFALPDVLPAPRIKVDQQDFSPMAMGYAAALTAACPRLAPAANLLPPERRMSNSRALFIPTAVLLVLLLIVSGALLGYSAIENRRYLEALQAEIARFEPQARHVASVERAIETARARSRLLDDFRAHTKQDLDALNELTRLLPPPTWSNGISLTLDMMTVSGEADQAAPLLKVIDSSPHFKNSEFTIPLARIGAGEQFTIRAARKTVEARR